MVLCDFCDRGKRLHLLAHPASCIICLKLSFLCYCVMAFDWSVCLRFCWYYISASHLSCLEPPLDKPPQVQYCILLGPYPPVLFA